MTDLFIGVNMTPGGVRPRIHVSQYDKGRNVVCELFDGNGSYVIPEGSTATIEGTKADNTGFQYDATISGNQVTFTITDQMTIFEGEVECEIVIHNSGYRQGSVNCILVVENAGLKSDVEISKTDLPLLQQVFEVRDEVIAIEEEVVDIRDEIRGMEGGAIESIETAKNESLGEIASATEGAIDSIAETKESALGEIETKKDESIAEMDEYAKLSESFAHGQTGIREGEDTDNSAYYAQKSKEYMEQAQTIVDVGFASDAHSGLAKGDGTTIHADSENGGKLSLTETYANHPGSDIWDNKVHGMRYDSTEEAIYITNPTTGEEIEFSGGGAGAVLQVTAPEGSTITVTGADTFRGEGGIVSFKIKNYGDYHVKAERNGQIAESDISITVAQLYTMTLKYFEATISATYPQGSSITCTNGSIVLDGDTSGNYTFVVPNAGTWTVECNDGESSASQDVVIVIDGQSASVTLQYFASTITVTYPEGATCTLEKGTEIQTATSNPHTFTVRSTGTYTIKATDGETTSEDTVEITHDGQSEARELTFFTATITVTYPADSTCTLLKAGTVIATATTNPYAFLVHKEGSYVVKITDGIKEKTKEVEITEDGQEEEVNLFYYRTMTVVIDETNSNPETALTYADNAVGMTPGSAEWDEFFGHYPCLFKDGQEVGRLQRDNFDKFEDGSTADISSGNAGDAMICFPRRGLKIERVGTNLYVSMTDEDNKEGFEYNAHTRGTARREQFYLGVYKGYVSSNRLRSLKAKTPTTSQTIGTFRTLAQANGSGYEQSAFYQSTYRQSMYILKYKNLNSQSTVGRGYVLSSHTSAISSGGTETWGMDCELIKQTNPTYMTDKNHHVKLFGVEDSYGNVWEFLDGIVTNANRDILTGNDGYNDSGTGYTNNGNGGVTTNIMSFLSKPQGTTKTGFVAKEVNASGSTYYCDNASIYTSSIFRYGGCFPDDERAGVFHIQGNDSTTLKGEYYGARLIYL